MNDRTSPRRHLLIAGAVWAVLSIVGILVVLGLQILPVIASREAVIMEHALIVLTVVSVPVLMFVVVGLAYPAIRFRARPGDQDGPPIHGHHRLEVGWVLGTFAMVVGLFVYGSIGLLDIRGDQHAVLEVEAHAKQWEWDFEYFGTKEFHSTELVLPVGQRVRILIEGKDVVHSFSVPAFGVKQDAVPGRITQIYVTPTIVGKYGVQCAELCGLGHTKMLASVTVMEPSDFADWLAGMQAGTGG